MSYLDIKNLNDVSIFEKENNFSYPNDMIIFCEKEIELLKINKEFIYYEAYLNMLQMIIENLEEKEEVYESRLLDYVEEYYLDCEKEYLKNLIDRDIPDNLSFLLDGDFQYLKDEFEQLDQLKYENNKDLEIGKFKVSLIANELENVEKKLVEQLNNVFEYQYNQDTREEDGIFCNDYGGERSNHYLENVSYIEKTMLDIQYFISFKKESPLFNNGKFLKKEQVVEPIEVISELYTKIENLKKIDIECNKAIIEYFKVLLKKFTLITNSEYVN